MVNILASSDTAPLSSAIDLWVKVKVTLRLTVGQLVCLGAEHSLGLVTRYYLLYESYCLVSVGRSFRREVGSVFCQYKSVIVCQYVHLIFIFSVFDTVQACMYIQYTQSLFQSRLGTADYALLTSSLLYHGSLDAWTVVHMTAAKFKPLIFSVSGFALSNVANIYMILDILLLVACMILLCNCKGTEFGKPHAYREPLCASEICHWCGEPYFAGAAISIGGFLPRISRWENHNLLQI
jgi:hypothetical protein